MSRSQFRDQSEPMDNSASSPTDGRKGDDAGVRGTCSRLCKG